MSANTVSPQIRVAIADDHPIVRAGVRGIFSSDRSIQVVGEAEDGQSAIALIRKGGR